MGTIVTLYPAPKRTRQRVFWLTIPHGTQVNEEPLASRSKRDAIADIEFYEGEATVHKCVVVRSARPRTRSRKRA